MVRKLGHGLGLRDPVFCGRMKMNKTLKNPGAVITVHTQEATLREIQSLACAPLPGALAGLRRTSG